MSKLLTTEVLFEGLNKKMCAYNTKRMQPPDFNEVTLYLQFNDVNSDGPISNSKMQLVFDQSPVHKLVNVMINDHQFLDKATLAYDEMPSAMTPKNLDHCYFVIKQVQLGQFFPMDVDAKSQLKMQKFTKGIMKKFQTHWRKPSAFSRKFNITITNIKLGVKKLECKRRLDLGFVLHLRVDPLCFSATPGGIARTKYIRSLILTPQVERSKFYSQCGHWPTAIASSLSCLVNCKEISVVRSNVPSITTPD